MGFPRVGSKSKQSILWPPTTHSGQRAHWDKSKFPVGITQVRALRALCAIWQHVARDQGRTAALRRKWTFDFLENNISLTVWVRHLNIIEQGQCKNNGCPLYIKGTRMVV